MEFLAGSPADAHAGAGVGAQGSAVPPAGCGCRGAVRVGETALADDELDERLVELGRARSRLEGLFARAVAEKQRRAGAKAAAAALRQHLRLSALQAGSDVDLAARLGERFPATLDALCSGEITAAHARVIARVGSERDHEDEPALLEMAGGRARGPVRSHGAPL